SAVQRTEHPCRNAIGSIEFDARRHPMFRFLSFASGALSCFVASALSAEAQTFMPGQYQLGDPAIQQICLKDDGTWNGTTFNFGGRWVTDPTGGYHALFGNYRV